MMFLGGTPLDRDLGTAPPNHSNRVVFDEQAMATGIATYAGFALAQLTDVPNGSWGLRPLGACGSFPIADGLAGARAIGSARKTEQLW